MSSGSNRNRKKNEDGNNRNNHSTPSKGAGKGSGGRERSNSNVGNNRQRANSNTGRNGPKSNANNNSKNSQPKPSPFINDVGIQIRSNAVVKPYWPISICDKYTMPHSLPLPCHWSEHDNLPSFTKVANNRIHNNLSTDPEIDTTALNLYTTGVENVVLPDGSINTSKPHSNEVPYKKIPAFVACGPLTLDLPLPPVQEARRIMFNLTDKCTKLRQDDSDGSNFELINELAKPDAGPLASVPDDSLDFNYTTFKSAVTPAQFSQYEQAVLGKAPVKEEKNKKKNKNEENSVHQHNLPSSLPMLVEGSIRVNDRCNFAYVTVDGLNTDLVLDSFEANRAFNGDHVICEVLPIRYWKVKNMEPTSDSDNKDKKAKGGDRNGGRSKPDGTDGKWARLWQNNKMMDFFKNNRTIGKVTDAEYMRQLDAYYKASAYGVKGTDSDHQWSDIMTQNQWMNAFQNSSPLDPQNANLNAGIQKIISNELGNNLSKRVDLSVPFPSAYITPRAAPNADDSNTSITADNILHWYNDELPEHDNPPSQTAFKYKNANSHVDSSFHLPLPVLDRFPCLWLVKFRLALLAQFFPTYTFQPAGIVISVRNRFGPEFVPKPISLNRLYSNWVTNSQNHVITHSDSLSLLISQPPASDSEDSDHVNLVKPYEYSTTDILLQKHFPSPASDVLSCHISDLDGNGTNKIPLRRGFNTVYALSTRDCDTESLLEVPEVNDSSIFSDSEPKNSLVPTISKSILAAHKGKRRHFTTSTIYKSFWALNNFPSPDTGLKKLSETKDYGISLLSNLQDSLISLRPYIIANCPPPNPNSPSNSEEYKIALLQFRNQVDILISNMVQSQKNIIEGLVKSYYLALSPQDRKFPYSPLNSKCTPLSTPHLISRSIWNVLVESGIPYFPNGSDVTVVDEDGTSTTEIYIFDESEANGNIVLLNTLKESYIYPCNFHMNKDVWNSLPQVAPRLAVWCVVFQSMCYNLKQHFHSLKVDNEESLKRLNKLLEIRDIPIIEFGSQEGQKKNKRRNVSLDNNDDISEMLSTLSLEEKLISTEIMVSPAKAFDMITKATESPYLPAIYVIQYTQWEFDCNPVSVIHSELAGKEMLMSTNKILPVLLKHNVTHTDQFSNDIENELLNFLHVLADTPPEDRKPKLINNKLVHPSLPKWRVPDWELKARTDLRDKLIFSIDPATAKDLDDALSVEHIPGSSLFRVGIHIADVSYFVRPNSHTDHEAQSRTTSVYLTGFVVPMLPRILCEQLCSLNPSVDRLAFSVFFLMSASGEIVGVEKGEIAKRTVIYNDDVIEGETDEELTLGDFVTLTKKEAKRWNTFKTTGIDIGTGHTDESETENDSEDNDSDDDMDNDEITLDDYDLDDELLDEPHNNRNVPVSQNTSRKNKNKGKGKGKDTKPDSKANNPKSKPVFEEGMTAQEAWESKVGESAWYGKTVIRSAIKLDYGTAQRFIDIAHSDPLFTEMIAERDAHYDSNEADAHMAGYRGGVINVGIYADANPFNPIDISLKLGLHSDSAILRQLDAHPEVKHIISKGERCYPGSYCGSQHVLRNFDYGEDGIDDDKREGGEGEGSVAAADASANAIVCDIIRSTRLLHSLGVQRRKDRFLNHGSLTFANEALSFTFGNDEKDFNEKHGIVSDSTDNTKSVTSTHAYALSDTNRIIEEYMLLSNVFVAQRIARTFPTKAVLRYHPRNQDRFTSDAQSLLGKFSVPVDVFNAETTQRSIDLIGECSERYAKLFTQAEAVLGVGNVSDKDVVLDDDYIARLQELTMNVNRHNRIIEENDVQTLVLKNKHSKKESSNKGKNDKGKGDKGGKTTKPKDDKPVVSSLQFDHISFDKTSFHQTLYRFHQSGIPLTLTIETLLVFCMRRATYFSAGHRDDMINDIRPLERLLLIEGATTTYELMRSNFVSFRHFALNFDYYTHFTSPIRRYPDIMNHRFLEASLAMEKTIEDLPFAPFYTSPSGQDPILEMIVADHTIAPTSDANVCTAPSLLRHDINVFKLIKVARRPQFKSECERLSLKYAQTVSPSQLLKNCTVSNERKNEAKKASKDSLALTLMELMFKRTIQRNSYINYYVNANSEKVEAPKHTIDNIASSLSDSLFPMTTVISDHPKPSDYDQFMLAQLDSLAHVYSDNIALVNSITETQQSQKNVVPVILPCAEFSFNHHQKTAIVNTDTNTVLPPLSSLSDFNKAPLIVTEGIILGKNKDCSGANDFFVFIPRFDETFVIDSMSFVGSKVSIGSSTPISAINPTSEKNVGVDDGIYDEYEDEYDALTAAEASLLLKNEKQLQKAGASGTRNKDNHTKKDKTDDKKTAQQKRNHMFTSNTIIRIEWSPEMAALCHYDWSQSADPSVRYCSDADLWNKFPKYVPHPFTSPDTPFYTAKHVSMEEEIEYESDDDSPNEEEVMEMLMNETEYTLDDLKVKSTKKQQKHVFASHYRIFDTIRIAFMTSLPDLQMIPVVIPNVATPIPTNTPAIIETED